MEEEYRGQRWYQNNKEKALAANKRYIEKKRPWHRRKREELRKAAIAAYGGKCACCAEGRWQFLTLDHPNGDGQADRAKHRMIIGQLYGWVARNNYPKDLYRILCMNCNWIRRFGGVCPHEEERNAGS